MEKIIALVLLVAALWMTYQVLKPIEVGK